MKQFFINEMQKTRDALQKMQSDDIFLMNAEKIVNCCVTALHNGKKVLLAGNGGSAADAQHLAAELVSRLRYDRPGLAAFALTTDTSALTAIGNDYSFEHLFSRQIEAVGQHGDVFIGISTSGKSPNILRAFEKAREKNITTIGFTRTIAPYFAERCDFVVNIPETETPKIQECHIVMGHIICAMIEEEIYGKIYNPERQKVSI